MKTSHLAICTAALLSVAPQLTANEQDQVGQATSIIERFRAMPEKGIPNRVRRDAKGVAILTSVKGGFIWSGRAGEGVVLARTKNGWSGPAFIRTGGAGFGPQIGGNITKFVIVLNTPDAVQAFSRSGNMEFSRSLSAAAGPIGPTGETGVLPKAAVYTYSHSQGLLLGASLEGTALMTNEKANERYYHKSVTPHEILTGQVTPPRGTARLRQTP